MNLDDGCELQLDSAAYISNGIQSHEDLNLASDLPLPAKIGSIIPNTNSLKKVNICPTFSTFTFTGWSLEQEERLMDDGKVQLEKVSYHQMNIIEYPNSKNTNRNCFIHN